jgi:putative hydrolase of the HAD superfamily
MNSQIKTIVFDFGKVIGFFDHELVYEKLAPLAGVSGETVRSVLFDAQLEVEYESGRMTTTDLLRHVRETCGFRCPDEELIAGYADMFWPNQPVCDLVPRLTPRYRLLLLSNTNEMHANQFRRQFADTLRHFDALVLSHEVGWRKPAPDIYTHCQRLAECEPAECVFIDDLPRNIDGARACGWEGIIYRDLDDLRQRLTDLGVANV